MELWILSGSYEGDPFASVHVQRKGALIAGILDVYDFLGIEDRDEYALRFPGQDNWFYTGDDLKALDADQVGEVFDSLVYLDSVYDNDVGYRLSIIKSRLAA